MTTPARRENNRRAQARLRERRAAENRQKVTVWLDRGLWEKCHTLADEEGTTLAAVVTNLVHAAYWQHERQATIEDA